MMIEPASLAVFFGAALLLAISPGPDNLFVLAQSMTGGRRAGFMITLGLCTGLLVHMTMVALGVAAVIKASSLAFTVLKMLGAAYLLYLAYRAFRASGIAVSAAQGKSLSLTNLYSRGIIMNVTNPKVTMFFLAFFQQFIDPENSPVHAQIILLGGVFILATLIIFGSVAALAGHLGEWMAGSQRAQILLHRMTGVLFAGLAIKLVLTQR